MNSKTFTDFDAFVESVRDAKFRMILLNPVRRHWHINHVDLLGLHIQLGREGSGNITEGQSRSDGYVFFLPLNNAGAYAANGVALDENSFAILEPGSDFCLRSTTEHDWCSIFVPTSKLARGGDLVEPSSASKEMTCRVSPHDLRVANQFRILADQIMTTAARHPNFEGSTAATHVESELVNVAREIVRPPRTVQHRKGGRPGVSRHEIVCRCNQLLEEHEDEPVGIQDLATVANVSQRTLRRAFRDYYGVTPIRYLEARRLHQVRRSLKAADSGALRVTDVLFRHGVWEVGRFAQRYRRQFGELPSETLKKR